MERFDALYARLPVWAQHGAVSFYGLYWHWLRFGPGYERFLQNYKEREKLTLDEWQAWQRERLRKLLHCAADNVPYYRNTWTNKEINAAKKGQLEVLPLLEKNPIRENPEAFLRQDIHPGLRLKFHTSGSTGTPIASIWTVKEIRNSIALREVRSANWAGVSFRIPRATFSGRIIEPDPDSKGPYYRFNLSERQVYLSAFHLRQETAHRYIQALHKHKIKWLTGYAVSYYVLARFIIEQKLNVPPLKAVITTSEKVTTGMRKTMEQAYGCKVYEEYSTVENTLFASECEHGKLHINPDVAIVEILRPDGTPCAPGEAGEIIATSLMRTYQPFIRYRIGDMAMWDADPCRCGRNMPVLKEVVGRVEDVVIGPDGRQMVRFHGIFTNQPHIQEGQIVQEALDQIRVKVVPVEGFNEMDIKDIIGRIQQRLGPKVKVYVEISDHIPRTSTGKFQAVVSLLHQQGGKSVEKKECM